MGKASRKAGLTPPRGNGRSRSYRPFALLRLRRLCFFYQRFFKEEGALSERRRKNRFDSMQVFFLLAWSVMALTPCLASAYQFYQPGDTIPGLPGVHPPLYVVSPGCTQNDNFHTILDFAYARGATSICGDFSSFESNSFNQYFNGQFQPPDNCYYSFVACSATTEVPQPADAPPVQVIGSIGTFRYPVLHILQPDNEYTQAFNFFFSCSVWITLISLPMKWTFKLLK